MPADTPSRAPAPEAARCKCWGCASLRVMREAGREPTMDQQISATKLHAQYASFARRNLRLRAIKRAYMGWGV